MNYDFRKITKTLFSMVMKEYMNGSGIQVFSNKLRNFINTHLTKFNRNERYQIYTSVMAIYRKAKHNGSLDELVEFLTRRDVFDTINISVRKSVASSTLREKKQFARDLLNDQNQIFFLCSSHIDPAEDHKDYQGRLYVDRFWRQKVNGSLYNTIGSYIRNHKILTIQYIMGEPVYLTTRPYCKHYFIPIQTELVLQKSARRIREQLHIGTQRDEVYDEEHKRRDRAEIYLRLNELYARQTGDISGHLMSRVKHYF